MPNNPKALDNLKPFKPGQSGNPAGLEPGTKHLSTHISKLMHDPKFEANIFDSKLGIREYKGAPVIAIIQVAINKAAAGDDKAREWLAKYGWGTKTEIEHSGSVDTGIADPKLAAEFALWYEEKTKTKDK